MLGHAWWERRAAVGVLLLLAVVPLIWPTIPPLLDLPGHMASYAISIAPDASPLLQRYYSFQWQLIGNLGLDVLMVPVGKIFGVELGTKLAVMTIPLLTVAGMLLVAREVHGRLPATTALALPLAYNYFFLFGFVNYCLAMAMAFWALSLWLHLGHRQRHGLRFALFVAISPVVWATHAVGWAVMAIMCGAAELQIQLSQRRPVAAIVATSLSCLALLSALVPMAFQPAGEIDGVGGWLIPLQLAKWMVTLFRDRWMWFDLASLTVVATVLGLAATRRLDLRISPVLAAAGGALTIAYIITPARFAGADFLHQRIIPYGLALFILGIDTSAVSSANRRRLAMVAFAFLLIRTAGLTASMAVYDREWQERLAVLDAVTPGSAIVTLQAQSCGNSLSNWASPRIDHLAGIATVRRDAFVNSLWTLHGIQLLRTHYAEAGAYQADPSSFVTIEPCGMMTLKGALARIPYRAFDYLWLVHVPPEEWPQKDARLQLLRKTGDSALFRIVPVSAAAR
ncbi:hypothetical protein NS334_07215 [Sphingomonas endophytica]|uniref:Glycosyltransferase RgtA/B/C/D-like domain-containing protein n=1 Tax=Sphingomonas endophytica TaxID=869719 RepID=A0A147I513_9SPHN|nr:hypothetical protein NS334_07215 [Sphingomonas endophytica]